MIDVEALDDVNEQRTDYRRASGAPMVSRLNDPEKMDRYRRPSSAGKNLDDENALVEWRIWKSMQGVARSRALAAKVNATKEEDKPARRELRDEAMDKGAANESADLGTALHAMTARVEDPDDDFDPPDQYVLDLDSYVATLAQYGLASEYVEVHIVNDAFRAAGTADRIFRTMKPLRAPDGTEIPVGTLLLGDIKTGKSLDFSAPGFCVQLALYATGVFYDVVTDRRIETPTINDQWAILVHLPVGKGHCTLHWVSVQRGVYGAWLSNEVSEWQRLWKKGEGDHDVPKISVPETAVEILAAVGIEAEVIMTTDIQEQMIDYCRARIKEIGHHADARRDLLLVWPQDLPAPNKITQPIEIVRLLDVLDAVEAKYSLPFLPDPRTGLQTGHKSTMARGNERVLIQES